MVYASRRDLKEIQSQYGLVFQNFNLFPHYSVMKNITDAPIRVQKRNREDCLLYTSTGASPIIVSVKRDIRSAVTPLR